MLALALSVLPIFLTIACGYGIARAKIIPRDSWGAIETLSFRLLIPAFLFQAIARSDLSSSSIGAMLWTLMATLALLGAAILLLRPVLRLPDPQLTTVFQTTIRWNALVTLAAAELFIGPQALVPIAIAIAVLVPIIQITSILVLVFYGTAQTGPRRLLKIILHNPMVQACTLGLVFNLLNIPLPDAVAETLRLIGNTALGIGLLVVGAGTRLTRLIRVSHGMVTGTVLRLACCPLLFYGLAQLTHLTPTETLTGLFCLAVPAASNGYVISKQMGGDADLYADILTWQTLLCLLALPVCAYLVA